VIDTIPALTLTASPMEFEKKERGRSPSLHVLSHLCFFSRAHEPRYVTMEMVTGWMNRRQRGAPVDGGFE
jgi:hypothetical protein